MNSSDLGRDGQHQDALSTSTRIAGRYQEIRAIPASVASGKQLIKSRRLPARVHDAKRRDCGVERRLAEPPAIGVPTIMLQGAEDRDNLPITSENREQYLTSRYERHLLPGVGHFVPREAPKAFVDAIQNIVYGNSTA
ncbi:alpha/beta fold hydrolase [Bradyrhizobium genosp. SA-3]|uniref:alpha/beta fold hydrolase n=1 Tax=Bradyrhizobium genosp. SA-3 TaxID=508868 RepID=UPI001029F7DC|nr:alpha/beta hydrolase [Bradyrhizobium genosp. SA-3]